MVVHSSAARLCQCCPDHCLAPNADIQLLAVGAAAWLPGALLPCTCCMEAVLATSLAPIPSWLSPDVWGTPKPPCCPLPLLQAGLKSVPIPSCSPFHPQPSQALPLRDLPLPPPPPQLFLPHQSSGPVFPSFLSCLEMLRASAASHVLLLQEAAQVRALSRGN